MTKIPPLPDTLSPYPIVSNIEFAEGPIFDENGFLYFVNYVERGTLGRMSPDGTVEIWVHTGGVANGLKYDGMGNIVAADHTANRITRFNTSNKKMDVLTSSHENKSYNGPNDICLDLSGNIYFSDPGNSTLENPIGNIYKIDMGANNQPVGVIQIEQNQAYPNGLAVHPDGSRFYFANSGLNQIVGYDMATDGTLSNKHVAVQFDTETVDGIMFDEHCRLWVARWTNGTIDVVDVDKGSILASYPAGGDRVTNMCWWGKSLYVTVAGANAIHKFEVGIASAQIIPRR